jgi:hypothetical protein
MGTDDVAADREIRNRAGMRLVAGIVRAGGTLPVAEVTRLTIESGYPTPGSWGGFLTGVMPPLARRGDDVIVTEAGWDWTARVVQGVAELGLAEMDAMGVAWP